MVNYTVEILKNDTFNGATVTVIPAPGETVDITGADIVMSLRYGSRTGTVSLTLNVNGGITILTATTFEINSQIITLAAGLYYSDIQITLTNGYVFTPVGIKFIVKQDVS